MKRSWLITLAAIAAFATGLCAQDDAFSRLGGDLPRPAPVAAPVVSAPAPVNTAPAATAAPREWLVMVFINGVNDLGILGFANSDLNEMESVGSTDQVAVLVEFGILGVDNNTDRNLQFQRGSKTVYITRDADANSVTSPVIYNSNTADMGSEAHLLRFIKRGLRQYPARKVAVVLWNHGSGRLGIASDDVTRNQMSIPKLGYALNLAARELGRKIDVFATDACLMQMASVAYEFKDAAKVIVGSEEIISGPGYPYHTVLGGLTASPGLDAEGLGRLLVTAFGANYPTDATLSAIRSSALPGFREALDAWVGALRAEPRAFAAAADQALVGAVSRFTLRDSKDLIDYIDRVGARLPAESAAKAAGNRLKAQIQRSLLVSSVAKPRNRNPYTVANGLAIYIPDLRYDSANYEGMAFAADSQWDDFLLQVTSEWLR
jgi:hypothetical protein